MKNKEEIKKELLETIDKYYREYKLPEMSISDGEFDALIDAMYIYLRNQEEQGLYMVIRKALNLSMQNEYKCFNLHHIISSLGDLKVFGLGYDDIENMKRMIMFNSLLNNATKSHSITK